MKGIDKFAHFIDLCVLLVKNFYISFSMMYMTVPSGLSYVNFEKKTDPRKDIPILCSAPSPSTNNTLKCDIGNLQLTIKTLIQKLLFF
jgi:hypothetical protein